MTLSRVLTLGPWDPRHVSQINRLDRSGLCSRLRAAGAENLLPKGLVLAHQGAVRVERHRNQNQHTDDVFRLRKQWLRWAYPDYRRSRLSPYVRLGLLQRRASLVTLFIWPPVTPVIGQGPWVLAGGQQQSLGLGVRP
jgi:hypothetical protein